MEHTMPTFQAAAPQAGAHHPATHSPLLDDPRFRTLVRTRRTFSWALTIVMLAVYFSFILTLAFYPALLGRPVVQGYPTTWGIPVGFGLFVFTFALVLVYVVRANAVYDRIVGQIREGAGQ